jgi:hypothetical protein
VRLILSAVCCNPSDFVQPHRLENWQTGLRKQYKKRDPDLNPIGPEPVVQLPTPGPDSPAGPDDDEVKPESVSTPGLSTGPLQGSPHQAGTAETDDPPGSSSTQLKLDEMKVESMSIQGTPLDEPMEESKDWLTLPMLTKLDSLHLLTEWQFHNVNRIRTIMKNDDETAQWARTSPLQSFHFTHGIPFNSGLNRLATTPRRTRIG